MSMNEGSVECEPTWMLAELAYPELERQARLKAAEFIGRLAMEQQVSVEPIQEPHDDATLMAAIQMAALGDCESRQVVKTNVATDVDERLFKKGHQTEVDLLFENGLSQNGRKLIDIHKNTLKYMPLNHVMRRRTEAELHIVLLVEELIGYGVLEENDVVVFEPTPADAATRRDYRFFTGTDSLSIQYIKGSGKHYVMETAFVAGKVRPDAPRHDLAAINKLTAENGAAIKLANADDVSRVMLVPKTPASGVHEIVQKLDDVTGGTFYGEDKPQQDYLAYREVCRERTRSFEEIVEAITAQLLSEAAAFESPMEAIERLDELSERFCVRRATTDITIEARIFGQEAAMHIEQARLHAANGDEAKANAALRDAQRTASSSSCPLFKGSDDGGDKKDDGSDNESENKWMNCPHCSAKVFGDPCAKVLVCWDCKAKVINGTTFKGDGGSKRRAEERAKRQAEQRAKQVEAPVQTQPPQPVGV